MSDTKTKSETKNEVRPHTDRSVGGYSISSVRSVDRHFNILIYGESGVGKTVLAGSADEVEGMAPILFIGVEGGDLSLDDHYPNVDVLTNRELGTFNDLQKVYDSLRRGDHDYNTVVIDSLTEANIWSRDDIMQEAKKTAKNPDKVDVDVPRRRDWGKNTTQTRKFVVGFRDLPMNVIFTSLLKTKEVHGRDRYMPDLPGKAANQIPGLFDVVCYMYLKRVKRGSYKRLLLTQRTDTEMAKDRSNRLPKVVEIPDASEEPPMKIVYDYIIGNRKVDES